jgi:competence protein ComEC
MSDRWAVVVAVVTCAAAWAAIDGPVGAVPLSAGLAVLALAVLLGRAILRPELLCLAAALLAAALAHRSLTGLEAPLATGPVAREVVLVGDPAPAGPGAVAADVRLGGRRLRATARGSAAAALDDRLAGERVDVTGTVARPGPAEALLRHRHLAGRLDVEVVRGWRPGGPVSRAANGLRRTLAAGAASLPERHRSLLAGVTLGDDRAQPADMTDAFRAAGLTHLLAVSGQNVSNAVEYAHGDPSAHLHKGVARPCRRPLTR